MNLNGKQIIAIIAAVVSVLMISTAQLTDLFGPTWAKTIVSIAGLINMVLNSVMAALTSQSNQIKDVAAMPGVQAITVNKEANTVLAAIATDPNQAKVAPAPEARAAVLESARGA